MSTERPDEGFLTSDEEPQDPTRRLIASVEELRALLAPLSQEERRRVLDLARSLQRGGEVPSSS